MGTRGKVIFAAADGSKSCKFPLWEDGKVRVGDVLAAFDASSVEFVDEDGMLSFLTPDASGLSTDSFIAGATVEIRVKPSSKLSDTSRTPPRPELIDLLRRRRLTIGSSLKEAGAWVEALPISFLTKRFLISHLYEVTNNLQIRCAHSIPRLHKSEGSSKTLPVVMRRKDYFELFRSRRNDKMLLLIGRRRQGKTCALGMEVVRARKERYKIQDRVIFYHAGENDIPSQRIDTIILVLAFMGIATCWDEFPLIIENLGKSYKLLLEDTRVTLDPLSLILWGSSESLIWDKGSALLSGMKSRGVCHIVLPPPNLEVILGMFYLSRGLYQNTHVRQELWDAESFLQMFALCGFSLADYAMGRSYSDVKFYGVPEVTGLSGEKLYAVKQILTNNNKVAHVDKLTLFALKNELIIEDREPGSTVNFLDPTLCVLSYLQRNQASTCTVIEGQVFEILVRSEHLLLPRVASVIAKVLEKPLSDVLSCSRNMLHGSFLQGVDCEVDGFFMCEDVVVLLNMKRLREHQSWVELERHLDKIWNAWLLKEHSKPLGSKKSIKVHPGQMLFLAKSILYMGISALDKGEGKAGFIASEEKLNTESDQTKSGQSKIGELKTVVAKEATFHDKPVRKVHCTLWELVKDIEPEVLKLDVDNDLDLEDSELVDRMQGFKPMLLDLSDDELG